MKPGNAEFWAAATTLAQVPKARRPEIALAGRSNVGKSSLLNKLCGRKALARISRTPGCTRGLVFFNIADRLTLVDLPGYGYAKRSSSERASWKRLVEGYLSERRELVGVLILVDVRRGPEEEELLLADFLDAKGIERGWVMTKCDKLARSRVVARSSELTRAAGTTAAIATSVKKGQGIDGVWKWIETVLSATTAAYPGGDRRRGPRLQ